MFRITALLPVWMVCSMVAEGQSVVMAPTPPEVELARMLLSDTVSRTVSHLPRGYWFGLEDRTQGSLVVVKDGPRNYVLRHGTHEVYWLRMGAGGPGLERLDSSIFAGDNFHMMAFLRRDTLYQYGGYGFWSTRDFFMRYRPAGRDWEFLTGGAGLPNELIYHAYDAAADAFYVMGSLSTTHHPYPRKVFVDSVYRYDFPERRWTTLGRLSEELHEFDVGWESPKSFCQTPFGMIDVRTSDLRLLDIPGNRILSAGDRLADTALTIGRSDRLYAPEYRLFLCLGDTLHVLQGARDRVVHHSFHVSPADFTATSAQPIYLPVGRWTGPVPYDWVPWVAALSLPAVGMAWWVRRRRASRAEAASGVADVVADGGKPEGQAPPPAVRTAFPREPVGGRELTFFLTHLSPAERDLLELLLRQSTQGQGVDGGTVNKVLGVSGKPDTIQKARRSVAINHINDAFRKTFQQEAGLLVRERDEFDKRAFMYRVDGRFLGLFDGHR